MHMLEEDVEGLGVIKYLSTGFQEHILEFWRLQYTMLELKLARVSDTLAN